MMNNSATNFTWASSQSTASSQGTTSSSSAVARRVMPSGVQVITTSASSSDPMASSAQASASASPNNVTATADAQPTDGVSESPLPIATSPPDAIFSWFPLLIAPVAEAITDDIVRPVPALIDYVLGTDNKDTLVGTLDRRDVLIGYGESDTFVLHTVGVSTVAQADVIADFSVTDGDRIELPTGITFNDLSMQPIDLDDDGTVESTVIRLGNTETILAIALNTVDAVGVSVLSSESIWTVANPLIP